LVFVVTINERTLPVWLHPLAWITAVTALLPISVGAVVTTLDAGMAFPDWLTADGIFVPFYPWLESTGDKFVEHGHRLAVIVMGVVIVLLAVGVSLHVRRADVRWLTAGIVAGFLAQAILGGQRVIQDERLLALLHGDFAACFFALTGWLVAMTSPRWQTPTPTIDTRRGTAAVVWCAATFAVLSVQYVLGGLLRHFGAAHAWLVHPWFAIVVVFAAGGSLLSAWRTEAPELRRAASWVAALIVAQALLGVVTWGARYGFPQWGVVAVQQSTWQVSLRSLHKVLGLVTFMAAFVALIRNVRAARQSLGGMPWPQTLASPTGSRA
jgi:cytochrome c oxidase assembly protein subunit 15